MASADNQSLCNESSPIKSIHEKIIHILQLDGKKDKDYIITDLLANGRQVLVMHQRDLDPKVYKHVMDYSNSELLNLLKLYFRQQWKLQYKSSKNWFIAFIKKYQYGEKHHLYDRVLTRTAEYGNKYMKTSPVLSIVLQLLFEGIDDDCLQMTNVFNDLWSTITNDGIESIERYSNYIDKDILSEQRNDKQSVLFRATRQYYHLQLLLNSKQILTEQELRDQILDGVTEYGWSIGVEIIQKNVKAGNSRRTMLQEFQRLLQTIQRPSSINENTTISVIDEEQLCQGNYIRNERY